MFGGVFKANGSECDVGMVDLKVRTMRSCRWAHA